MLLTNRLTCAWVPGGTETWRNQSRMVFRKKKGENVLGNYGTNLQNLSDDISRIIIPDEGYELTKADLAAAESWIVAYICPDGNYRRMLLSGIDPHGFTALHFFQSFWREVFPSYDIDTFVKLDPSELIHVPEWKDISKTIKGKHKVKRFIGKKGGHSFNYDKHPNGFRFDVLKESEGKVVIPLRESERLHSVYHTLFSEIQKSFHRETDTLLRTTRILFNFFGFPREFYYEKLTDNMRRQAIAWRPQSTIGCLTNIAYVKCQNYIEDNDKDWDMLNNQHDSLLIQGPVKDREEIEHTLRSALEVEFTNDRGEKFKMKSDLKRGMNWGDFDEKDNPNGMKEI